MIPNDNKPRRHFKQLEQRLTAVVLGDLVLFVLTLVAAANGIFWLKLILGLLTMAISCMGCVFLVMIREHRRSRSWWILASFGAMFLCTLVSFLTKYPTPPLS